jgi:hypothetical protein
MTEDGAIKTKAEKASQQLTRMVGSVVRDGVGPVTGSVAWAEARLARIQGERYVPNDAPTRRVNEADAEDVEKAIKRLIVESVEAAGVNGFLTGLGGLIVLPVALPANLAGALVINARLAGAIAYLRGYDPLDPHVQTMVALVAVGSNVQRLLADLGVKVANKVAMKAIAAIPIKALHAINRKVGFMLLAKYGTKRASITLVKLVPGIGGLVGGAVDAAMTAAIGKTAKSIFPAD